MLTMEMLAMLSQYSIKVKSSAPSTGIMMKILEAAHSSSKELGGKKTIY